MIYQVYGPYELPKKRVAKGKTLDLSREAQKLFWEDVDRGAGVALHSGRGCYVFAHRASKGYKPWYVGQSKKSFKGEVFTDRNKNNYEQVYRDLGSATPILFFVARLTENGQLSNRTLSADEADFLEQKLIGYAVAKNERLTNVSNTRFHRKMTIPGLHNSAGKLSRPAQELKTALGLK